MEDRRSKYYYEDVDVLINKMDIKDKELLDEYERRIVSLKLFIIEHTKFNDKFDINHLKEIHNFLFSEIYSFAGEFREENLAKDDFRFAACDFIESELTKLLVPILDFEELKKYDIDEISKKIAHYISEINVIHPFREGNGRTYREFVRQFAAKCGWNLNWSKCPYEEIYLASINSVYDDRELIEVIKKCLSKD